jgi:hypothetical protein
MSDANQKLRTEAQILLFEHIEHAMQALEQDLPGEAWLALKHAQRLSNAASSWEQAP